MWQTYCLNNEIFKHGSFVVCNALAIYFILYLCKVIFSVLGLTFYQSASAASKNVRFTTTPLCFEAFTDSTVLPGDDSDRWQELRSESENKMGSPYSRNLSVSPERLAISQCDRQKTSEHSFLVNRQCRWVDPKFRHEHRHKLHICVSRKTRNANRQS